MKSSKTRHQLFLSAEDSARLARMADATGRSRSDILKEAFEAYLSGRKAPSKEDGFEAILARLERRAERVQRNVGLQWEILARLMRHQMQFASGLPRPEQEQLASAKEAFERLLDEISERLEGKQIEPTGDAALEKIRRLH
ncbi:MAG TPA: ribbon-helix-helix protein, CopG family [Methyloceanibacter sp.]|nr:ribbon-helix-helix protein, CopG family [Methyloceanibacter sp.]